jgi:hypothetical protein
LMGLLASPASSQAGGWATVGAALPTTLPLRSRA